MPSMKLPTGRQAVRGVAIGLAAGVVAGLVADAVRPRGGRGRLVDWEEIRRRARAKIGAHGELSAAERGRLSRHYDRLAAELRGPLLAAVGGAQVDLPGFDALSRQTWIDLNVDILRRTIEPMIEAQVRIPNSRIVDLGRAGLNRYVATVLGFLGERVLGQFDPQLLGKEPVAVAPASALYLVEPNIAAWQERAKLPGEQLRRWIILHELTHAWQFGAHPWLRDHLNEMLEEVVGMLGDRRRGPLRQLASLTVGAPRQWAVLRRMQATMSLVEGYGNLIMNLVGRDVLPGFERLEAAHRERSRERGALELLFWKLTGLDLKLQQYERGESFARAVHDAYGMEVLNRAWEGPETLPRLEELGRPGDWYRRISGLAPAGPPPVPGGQLA